MRYWVQYHNYEKMQTLPPKTCGVVTDREEIRGAIGDTIFLIVGISEKPRQYLLWERFVCEKVLTKAADKGKQAAKKYEALGSGWFLLQRRGREPLLNPRPGFHDYLLYTSNFSRTFHEVTEHPFLETLLLLSEQCKPPV